MAFSRYSWIRLNFSSRRTSGSIWGSILYLWTQSYKMDGFFEFSVPGGPQRAPVPSQKRGRMENRSREGKKSRRRRSGFGSDEKGGNGNSRRLQEGDSHCRARTALVAVIGVVVAVAVVVAVVAVVVVVAQVRFSVPGYVFSMAPGFAEGSQEPKTSQRSRRLSPSPASSVVCRRRLPGAPLLGSPRPPAAFPGTVFFIVF